MFINIYQEINIFCGVNILYIMKILQKRGSSVDFDLLYFKYIYNLCIKSK